MLAAFSPARLWAFRDRSLIIVAASVCIDDLCLSSAAACVRFFFPAVQLARCYAALEWGALPPLPAGGHVASVAELVAFATAAGFPQLRLDAPLAFGELFAGGSLKG